MAQEDPPITAQTVLSSLLLASTAFTNPSLASLRTLLNNTLSTLSASTSDAQLKIYLREITDNRTSIRRTVERDITNFKLIPKRAVKRAKLERAREEEEDAEDEGVELEEIGLETALERLEQEEKALERELDVLDEGINEKKQALDSCVYFDPSVWGVADAVLLF